MYALRHPRPELDYLSPAARGHQKRRKVGRSTPLTGEIIKIMATAVSSPWIRRRRGISGIPMTQRSGARFTALHDTIWKSARLFWIGRRCHHQQRWRLKSSDRSINAGSILTVMNRWERSM
jgi:hypothetical protein